MLIAFTKLLFYQMARKAPRIIFNHVARIRSYHRRIAFATTYNLALFKKDYIMGVVTVYGILYICLKKKDESNLPYLQKGIQ